MSSAVTTPLRDVEDAPPQGARVQLSLLPAQLRSFGPPGSIVVKDQAFSATDVFGPVLIRGNVVSGGPRPATCGSSPTRASTSCSR